MRRLTVCRILHAMCCLTIVAMVLGCSSTPKVERKDVDTTIDISGQWNDTDSRMVSEEMMRDCLERPWVRMFMDEHGGKVPTVIVGQVKNRSHEHINVQTFVKDLERHLINSGRVRFVASREERTGIREERLDMAKHASDKTMKSPGEESGADFMLIGTINTIKDEFGNKAVMFYQTNLELINMADNIKVWVGEKKIKKLITKRRITW